MQLPKSAEQLTGYGFGASRQWHSPGTVDHDTSAPSALPGKLVRHSSGSVDSASVGMLSARWYNRVMTPDIQVWLPTVGKVCDRSSMLKLIAGTNFLLLVWGHDG